MPRRIPLKQRLQHDENLILKALSEMGDFARFMRNMQAQIISLRKRLEKLEGKN